MNPTLNEDAARQAMRDRLGAITGWEDLGGGENSRAFAFANEGRGLVVRVGSRREGFGKDAWAAKRVVTVIAPVPEVLEIGELDTGAYYCVSERIGGTRYDQCDAPAQRRAAPGVQAAADAIASVDVSGSEGFGPIDPATECGPHPTWASYLRSLLPDDRDGLDDPIDVALTTELAEIASGIAEAFPPIRQLVHGDLTPGNFHVEGERVTGVFDWESVLIGDPLWDIARNLMWAPMMPTVNPMIEYQLDRLAPEPGIAERLRCLVIVNTLWAVKFFHASGRHDAADLMLNRVHGFLGQAQPLDTGRDYWMGLLKPGSDRSAR
jgi:hygromycin-B 4-O-kinase